MNTPQNVLEYRQALLTRLLKLYIEGARIPCDVAEPIKLSVPLVQRLYRCVLAEGYGQ